MLAALAIVAGALLLAGVSSPRRAPGARRRRGVLVVCVAWAYALVQRGPIAG